MKKEVPDNNISPSLMEKIIDELQNDETITELSFVSNTPLNNETTPILMDYLKTNNTIKSLQLSAGNYPSHKIATELGEMLKVNSTLETLIYRN